jgi:hypothetical protein
MWDLPGFHFVERMAGTYQGLRPDLPGGAVHFELDVKCPQASLLDSVGRAVGKVTIEGLAADAPAEGTLELSPLWKRRIRYRFGFVGTDGRRYRFEGQKRIRARQLVRSWTTLPSRVYDEGGVPIAEAVLRFDLTRELLPFLRSWL